MKKLLVMILLAISLIGCGKSNMDILGGELTVIEKDYLKDSYVYVLHSTIVSNEDGSLVEGLTVRISSKKEYNVGEVLDLALILE